MSNRIVEVANDGCHLSLYRGFLIVENEIRAELGRIPLDDIGAVVANSHGITYSNSLVVSLAERGIPFIICGSNHNVVGILFSVSGHHLQSKRFDAQIRYSDTDKQILWQEIIKSKLKNQGDALACIGASYAPLHFLISQVDPGDTKNIEAIGAKRYWRLLLGNKFRRDRHLSGANALLNYGYTILRATTARAICAAGLHPSIGLHHCNESNPMRLVDDLMEPFRPIVDRQVWNLFQNGVSVISPSVKQQLALCMFADVVTQRGISPLHLSIKYAASSLANIYLGEKTKLELPINLFLEFNKT